MRTIVEPFTCLQTLHAKSAFKNHEPLELGKLVQRKPSECAIHKKDAELFCENCQTVLNIGVMPLCSIIGSMSICVQFLVRCGFCEQVVCLKCYSFGDHQKHHCIPLAERVQFVKVCSMLLHLYMILLSVFSFYECEGARGRRGAGISKAGQVF